MPRIDTDAYLVRRYFFCLPRIQGSSPSPSSVLSRSNSEKYYYHAEEEYLGVYLMTGTVSGVAACLVCADDAEGRGPRLRVLIRRHIYVQSLKKTSIK